MTNHESLAALEARISKAVKDCETWRATGLGESYMEAYDLVEALQLELRRRLRVTTSSQSSK